MPPELSQNAAPGRFVMLSVLLMAAMTIMANATIAPALPGLKAHFADVEGIDTLAGLILSLPSASIILSAGVFGWLADRVDRQKLLMLAAGLYAVGGTSGLWAHSLTELLIGRSVLGLGVAGTMTLAMVWGSDLWQGAARARFMGLQGASMSAGGIVVMLLGGVLGTMGWRGPFAVYALVVPVALLALVALAPHSARLRQDRAGRDAARAAAPDEVFPWGAFAMVGSLAFLFMMAFYIMPTRMPFLLDEMGVTNSMIVGAVMASMTLAAIPGALSYGRIRRYLSPMQVFALSYGLMGLGVLLIGQADSVAVVVVGTLVAGLGMGPAMPNYTTYFMSFVPSSLRGRASGMLTTAFFAGQFASPLVSAPLVAGFGLAGAFDALGLALMALAAGLLVVGQRRTAPAL